MDVGKRNSSADGRCFTCQTKSNLLYLTTYPHSQDGSLREKSPSPGDGRDLEKQPEALECPKCNYYIEFISNLMDGIICDELHDSIRKDGVHDCSTRPELDSSQKVKIVQKLYILFSDAQVAALGGRLKKRKPSCFSDESSNDSLDDGKDTCRKIENRLSKDLEVIPELESQCGSANKQIICVNQEQRQVISKDNKVAVRRKSNNSGHSCLSKIDQRRRSSACNSFGSQKSKNSSLSGCSCRSGAVASSDSNNVRLLSVKNRPSVENERIQQRCYEPVKKCTGEKNVLIGKSGRFKRSTSPPRSNNSRIENIKRNPGIAKSEPLQKARTPQYSSIPFKKCCRGVPRKIQRSQSASKLKAESYDELVSGESNLNLMGVQKSILYHTNSYGKCTSFVIAGSTDQPTVSDGSHNIRIDIERLKKRHGRK